MKSKLNIVFWLILTIGSALRLYDPTFRSLWGDEGHSLYSALAFGQGGLNYIWTMAKESHLPAYFLLLAGWIKYFGTGEYGLRLLSILIGISSLALFYFLARELFGDRERFLSLLLLALSPLALMHSQEIRMYGLMLMFSLLSSLFFWRNLQAETRRFDQAGYFIASLLLALTHIYASLFIAAQALYLIIGAVWQKKAGRIIFNAMALMAVVVMVAPLYSTIIYGGLRSLAQGSSDMAFAAFPWFLKLPLFFFVLALGETVAPWNWPVVLPAALVFGALILNSLRSYQDERIMFLLVGLFMPVLIAAGCLPPTMPKYLIFCLPGFLLLASYSLQQIKNKVFYGFAVALLVIVQLCSIGNYFLLKEYHNANQIEPWRQVAQAIREERGEGEQVIASNYFIVYRLLNYYFNVQNDGEVPLVGLQRSDFRLQPSAGICSRRLWLVTQIADDRAFPPDYIKNFTASLSRQYLLVSQHGYVPYEQTLVSHLPINRHQAGSERITVALYRRKG